MDFVWIAFAYYFRRKSLDTTANAVAMENNRNRHHTTANEILCICLSEGL